MGCAFFLLSVCARGYDFRGTRACSFPHLIPVPESIYLLVTSVFASRLFSSVFPHSLILLRYRRSFPKRVSTFYNLRTPTQIGSGSSPLVNTGRPRKIAVVAGEQNVIMKTMLPLVAGCALLASSARAQDITFTATDRTVPFPTRSFIQGDINRDGIPDFLGVSPGLSIYGFKSNGIGNYVPWTIPTSYCPANPLAFGVFTRDWNDDDRDRDHDRDHDFKRNRDHAFDHDGDRDRDHDRDRDRDHDRGGWRNDLLVSSTGGPVCSGGLTGSFSDYLNNGFGKFPHSKQVPLTSSAALAAVVADFTGDKILDAVILDGNTLELYKGDGHGGFTGPTPIATLIGSAASQTGGFYNVIAGDYDGNGCPDVAWLEHETAGNLTQVHVAYGDCNGGFTVTTPYPIVGQIDNIQTIDLDRDGISDIVGTVDAFGGGANGPTLAIVYGQHDRTFNLKLIGDPSLTGPLVAADMNGDGYPDIAYISTSASGSEIKILEGDSTQSFANISTYPLPDANGTPEQFAFGDYNRDGKMDLALLSTGTSGNPVFTILTNTSAYPGGACVVPVMPGVHVCSPGVISGPTVNVLAAGRSVNPAVFMELWVDGVKQVQYGSTSEMRATLNLTHGWHRLGFYAIDAAANKAHEVRYVFVN